MIKVRPLATESGTAVREINGSRQLSNMVGDKAGTEVAAERFLNDAFHETLISWNEDSFTFSYSIDDGPEPVSKASILNYIGVVKFRPVTDSNGTFIEWSSSYEAAMENEVADFCNPIYAGLLASLKASLK